MKRFILIVMTACLVIASVSVQAQRRKTVHRVNFSKYPWVNSASSKGGETYVSFSLPQFVLKGISADRRGAVVTLTYRYKVGATGTQLPTPHNVSRFVIQAMNALSARSNRFSLVAQNVADAILDYYGKSFDAVRLRLVVLKSAKLPKFDVVYVGIAQRSGAKPIPPIGGL